MELNLLHLRGGSATVTIVLIVLPTVLVSAPRSGQQPQQRQQLTQEQMHQQMTQLMQRMDQIAVRAQDLSRTMTQQMAQIREQNREQARLLQQLCDAVGTQVREAARTLEQLRSMLESRAVVADQETLRDLDRIRERAAGVAEGLHEMLNLMERMHMRLRTREQQDATRM